MKHLVVIFCGMILIFGCHMPSPPPTPDPDAELIEKGRQIFFNETFEGNGRTCGSCHPAAVKHLKESLRLISKAKRSIFSKSRRARQAIEEQEKARDQMVETS